MSTKDSVAEKQQYWPASHTHCNYGVVLEYRSNLALDLLERFALVGAKLDGEDSANRAKYELQTPQELVNRAFAIADLFTDEAVRRGELREQTEEMLEEAHRRGGKLRRIANAAEFPRKSEAGV